MITQAREEAESEEDESSCFEKDSDLFMEVRPVSGFQNLKDYIFFKMSYVDF